MQNETEQTTEQASPSPFSAAGSIGRAIRRMVDIAPQVQDDLATCDPQPRQNLSAVSERMRSAARAGGALSARDVEQIIGNTNDLLDVNYLQRGLLASRTVAFIKTPRGSATGFLVGLNLLLTNWHVLPSLAVAAESSAVFDYELDLHGLRSPAHTFRLAPQQGFWNSEALDYALVALEPRSSDSPGNNTRELADWGFLRLSGDAHKTDVGLDVSVIGHPQGQPKQIALRENKVLQVGDSGDFPLLAKDDRLWYQTDTQPGNSGSPVFNDLWQVVALHHAAVPRSREQNGEKQYLLRPLSDSVTDAEQWISASQAGRYRDDQIVWVANQGIRISSLVADLRKRQAAEAHPILSAWVSDLDGQPAYAGTSAEDHLVTFAGHSDAGNSDSTELLERGKSVGDKTGQPSFPPNSYADRDGYDPNFLAVPVPLPDLSKAVERFGPAVPLSDGSGIELKYRHFSVVMSQQRHMAYFTVVNIDGAQAFDYPRKNDVWHFDSRIPAEFQIDNRMYSNEPGAHGFFDRGHLVRRRDPIWGVGDVLKQANDDTFHWTNCSPQYWEFNQSDTLWQGLENFIFANTDKDNLKVTVLTGPIFADDDPLHRQIQIPQQFWKVVAVCDAAGTLMTSAYTVSQAPFVKDIPFEALPVGPYSTFQVGIPYLEGLTGLNFSETVRAADVFTGKQPKKLDRVADIAPLKPIQPAVQTVQQAASPSVDQLGVELENGQVLYFELAQADNSEDSKTRQLGHDGGPFLQVGETLQAALKKALPTLTDISRSLQDINQPDELWLQIGLKVTADANIILARLGTEGTLNVTLKWINTLPDGIKKPLER